MQTTAQDRKDYLTRKKYGRHWKMPTGPGGPNRGSGGGGGGGGGENFDFSLLNALGDLARSFEYQVIPTLSDLEALAVSVLQTDAPQFREREEDEEYEHEEAALLGRRRRHKKYTSEEWDTGAGYDGPDDDDASYEEEPDEFDDVMDLDPDRGGGRGRGRGREGGGGRGGRGRGRGRGSGSSSSAAGIMSMSEAKYGKPTSNPKYQGSNRPYTNGSMRSRYKIPTLNEAVAPISDHRQLDQAKARRFYDRAREALGTDFEPICQLLELSLGLYKGRSVDHVAVAAIMQTLLKDHPALLQEFFAITSPADAPYLPPGSARPRPEQLPFMWELAHDDARKAPLAKRPRDFGLERFPPFVAPPRGASAVGVPTSDEALAARGFLGRAKLELGANYANFLDHMVALRLAYRANQVDVFEKRSAAAQSTLSDPLRREFEAFFPPRAAAQDEPHSAAHATSAGNGSSSSSEGRPGKKPVPWGHKEFYSFGNGARGDIDLSQQQIIEQQYHQQQHQLQQEHLQRQQQLQQQQLQHQALQKQQQREQQQLLGQYEQQQQLLGQYEQQQQFFQMQEAHVALQLERLQQHLKQQQRQQQQQQQQQQTTQERQEHKQQEQLLPEASDPTANPFGNPYALNQIDNLWSELMQPGKGR